MNDDLQSTRLGTVTELGMLVLSPALEALHEGDVGSILTKN